MRDSGERWGEGTSFIRNVISTKEREYSRNGADAEYYEILRYGIRIDPGPEEVLVGSVCPYKSFLITKIKPCTNIIYTIT